MGLENHASEPQADMPIPAEAGKTPEELRADAQLLLEKLDTQSMKDLANPQEQEFLAELEQNGSNAQEAFDEFKQEMKALDTIEEKFSGMENYEQFETFLQSDTLSPDEMEAFLATV